MRLATGISAGVVLCSVGLCIAAADDGAHDFEAIVPVLRDARCMNCHSTGDFPRQGDDGHRHTMDVRRGPHGDGPDPVKCSTCHQDHNVPGLHAPPGAPEWELPPPEMPMIWEGLSDAQLCALLKDPQRNGNRTVQQIVDHMATPLVAWGWNPGEGRRPIAMPREEFLAHVSAWAGKGAGCPAAEAGDPWQADELLEPEAAAREITDEGANVSVLFVGFPSLYRGAHIPGAALAGPASKPEGLEALKAAARGLPRDREVLIYCGCCPFVKCPNVRPAYEALRQMGFGRVRVIHLETNFHTDWVVKGYATERPAAANPS